MNDYNVLKIKKYIHHKVAIVNNMEGFIKFQDDAFLNEGEEFNVIIKASAKDYGLLELIKKQGKGEMVLDDNKRIEFEIIELGKVSVQYDLGVDMHDTKCKIKILKTVYEL